MIALKKPPSLLARKDARVGSRARYNVARAHVSSASKEGERKKGKCGWVGGWVGWSVPVQSHLHASSARRGNAGRGEREVLRDAMEAAFEAGQRTRIANRARLQHAHEQRKERVARTRVYRAVP